MDRSESAVNTNRAGDHLANERTYLAWIRTAVALMGFGLVVVRLRYLLPPQLLGHAHGWELGLVFTLIGLFLVPLANRHYFRNLRSIENDHFEPASTGITFCSAAIVLLGIGVLAYLLFSPGMGSLEHMTTSTRVEATSGH